VEEANSADTQIRVNRGIELSTALSLACQQHFTESNDGLRLSTCFLGCRQWFSESSDLS